MSETVISWCGPGGVLLFTLFTSRHCFFSGNVSSVLIDRITRHLWGEAFSTEPAPTPPERLQMFQVLHFSSEDNSSDQFLTEKTNVRFGLSGSWTDTCRHDRAGIPFKGYYASLPEWQFSPVWNNLWCCGGGSTARNVSLGTNWGQNSNSVRGGAQTNTRLSGEWGVSKWSLIRWKEDVGTCLCVLGKLWSVRKRKFSGCCCI